MIPDSRITPTRREIQVLRLIAYGLSNKEIAFRLDIAECTVKNHLLNMFQRLGFCNRVHAVVTGFKRGWIALSEIEELTLGRVADSGSEIVGMTLGRVPDFSRSFPEGTAEQPGRAASRNVHTHKGSSRIAPAPNKSMA